MPSLEEIDRFAKAVSAKQVEGFALSYQDPSGLMSWSTKERIFPGASASRDQPRSSTHGLAGSAEG